ncbi:hypothetical protein FYZ35_10620 [Mobiluncus mulieris]|nr:hypothetical protein [Mobiluncus mulieris]MCU9976514.1 hypothetical protein [Mobiluncus mulieris]MCV0014867.1 hypothetical protein [Mobiluncus mulieris]
MPRPLKLCRGPRSLCSRHPLNLPRPPRPPQLPRVGRLPRVLGRPPRPPRPPRPRAGRAAPKPRFRRTTPSRLRPKYRACR